MSENWVLILKLVSGISFGGAFAALCLTIRYIWIARIQKNNAKLVELRQDADGTKLLTIKGYSQEEQAKIVKQLTRNNAVDFPVARNLEKPSQPSIS